MLKFQTYRNNYQNCYQLLLSSLLKRLDLNEKMYWYQSIPFYDSKEKKLFFSDYGDFKLSSIWKKYDNIKINYIKQEEYEMFISNLIKHLKIRNIGIFIDLFFLPYSMYYLIRHDIHAIEIINYKKKTFIIADHYYNYYGTLKYSDLIKSLISYKKIFSKKFSFFYIEETTPKIVNNEKEKLLINKHNNNLYDIFNFIKEDILSLSRCNNLKVSQEIGTKIYSYLKDFSGTQKMLYFFISELINYDEKYNNFMIKEISYLYKESSENLNMIANFLLKNIIKQNLNYPTEKITYLLEKSLVNNLKIQELFRKL